MQNRAFDFHGIRCLVSCEPTMMRETVLPNFRQHLSNVKNRADLEIEIGRARCFSDYRIDGWESKFGTDFYLRNGEVLWRDGCMELAVKNSNVCLAIRGSLSLMKHQFIRYRLSNSVRNGFDQLCMRYLIHYPLLMALNQKEKISLLHGSAVKTERGAIVFAGDNGCGKSTTAKKINMDLGRGILADNYVIIRKGNVLPFQEVLRISPLEEIPAGYKEVQKGLVHGKKQYEPINTTKQPVPLKKMVLLKIGKKEKYRRVSTRQFVREITDIHSSMKDFPWQSRWPVALKNLKIEADWRMDEYGDLEGIDCGEVTINGSISESLRKKIVEE